MLMTGHLSNLLRCLCRVSLSLRVSTSPLNLVSSANIFSVSLSPVSKSWIKMLKRTESGMECWVDLVWLSDLHPASLSPFSTEERQNIAWKILWVKTKIPLFFPGSGSTLHSQLFYLLLTGQHRGMRNGALWLVCNSSCLLLLSPPHTSLLQPWASPWVSVFQ